MLEKLFRRDKLDSKDMHERMKAVLELVQARSPRAAEAVVKGLHDESHDVRMMAARAASGWPGDQTPLRDAQVVAALVEALSDRDSATQRAAAFSLARIGAPEALPALLHVWPQALAAYQPGYDAVYEGVAAALGASGRPEALAPLLDLLQRGDERQRQIVRGPLRALGQLTVEPVIALLDDPEPAIRIEAAEHLGAIRAAEAAERLVAMLDDPGKDSWLGFPRRVRDAAKSALVKIGAPAVPLLTRAVAEGGKRQRPAAEALNEIRTATA